MIPLAFDSETPSGGAAATPVDLGAAVGLTDIWSVAVEQKPVTIGPEACARMRLSADFLAHMAAERRRIYGVTTGYGPLAQHYVAPELSGALQLGLIHHLASGVGVPLSPSATRAVMAARLACLARGHSGIGPGPVGLMVACLNEHILPVIPEMGTVGASGDLTPLAHVALALVGDGPVRWGGEQMRATEAFAAVGLAPVTLGIKEGLALVNGTSAMTGIAALNGTAARRAAHMALAVAAAAAEFLGAHGQAYDPRFGAVRPHPGQIEAHAILERLLEGGRRLRADPDQPPVLDERTADDGVMAHRAQPQDPYTLRCLPQIFGAVLDVLDFHDRIIATELVSVTDNPIIFADEEAILHGGNFYGQHVAFASDALAPAVIKIAIHAERMLARLCDPAANGGLPAFLAGGRPGLSSGLMGAQVTASALVAEMRTLAIPASIQSIPTNGNNQDVVTLGTIAARRTHRLIELLWHVLAIHAIGVAQAVDLSDGEGFSPAAHGLVARVRARSPMLQDDRPLGPEISELARQAQFISWA